MALVECPVAPAEQDLAINDVHLSMFDLIAFKVIESHQTYWERKQSEGHAFGGILTGLLNQEVRGLVTTAEKPLTPESLEDLSQSSAQLLSVLGLSMLLRTEEFRAMSFQQAGEGSTELLEAYIDIHARDSVTLFAGPDVLAHLPAPAENPADTWYRTGSGTLYVHREQPPVPSAGALEHDKDVFENLAFYETYAGLTAYPARPS